MKGKGDNVRLVNNVRFWLSVLAVLSIALLFMPYQSSDGARISPAITGQTTHPPPSDLIAHWKFDDGSGLAAADSSSFANHGSLKNGPSWVSGKVDGGLRFDGVNDYVEVAHSNSYLLSDGSVTLWFKTDDVAKDQGMFSKDSNGFDTGGHLTVYLQDSRMKARIQSTSASFTVQSDIVQPDVWYHVAVTFGSGGLKLYVDGVLFTGDVYTGGLLGNLEPIAFGAKSWNSDNLVVTPTTFHSDGVIDDVRMYNRALDSSEINALVSPPPATPPVTSIFCNGDDCLSSVYSNLVTISWTCSDDTGCASTKYCVDADNTCVPSIVYDSADDPVIFNLGSNNVRFFSVDIDGNIEDTKSQVVSITSAPDPVLPETSIRCDGDPCLSTSYVSPVTVTLTCTDDVGCGATFYCIDTIDTCDPSTVFDQTSEPVISTPGDNYVRFFSVDIDGNTEFVVSELIIMAADSVAPVLSSEQPVMIVPMGTTQTSISVMTDEDATCKYSNTSGANYDDPGMLLFDTTGTTSHSKLIANLSDGDSFTIYVKCKDANGNVNSNDFEISIEVATTTVCGDGLCAVAEHNVCAADCALVRGNVSDISHNFLDVRFDVDNSDNYYQFFDSVLPVKLFEVRDDFSLVERVTFDFSFDLGKWLRLNRLRVERQDNSSNIGRLFVAGLNLTNERKKISVDKLNSSSDAVCIMDTNLVSMIELSSSCTAESETLVNCDGVVVDGYSCSIQSGYLEVTGLRHSLVEEYLEVCGNNRCDVSENCNVCASDCGSCSNNTDSENEGVAFQVVTDRFTLEQYLAAGDVGTFSFSKYVDDLSVYRVAVVSENVAVNPFMTIKITSLGESVTNPAGPGEVIYTIISLSGSGIESSLSTVSFKVLNSWIAENEIGQNTVIMKRLKSGSWQVFDTSLNSDDGSYRYYTSTFSGLSTFAIVGKIVRRNFVRDLVSTGTSSPRAEPATVSRENDFFRQQDDVEGEPLVSEKRFNFAFKQIFYIVAVLAAVFLVFEGAVYIRKKHRAGGLMLSDLTSSYVQSASVKRRAPVQRRPLKMSGMSKPNEDELSAEEERIRKLLRRP